jgi:hypothetical protein
VPAEFYGEGCDASSYVTVDVGIEKPSGLSKEFDFGPAEENVEDVVVAPAEEEIVAVAEAGAEPVVAPVTEEVVDVALVAEAVEAVAPVADDVAL